MDNRKYVLYSIKNPFDVESPLSDSVHDLLLNKLEELGCSNYFACFEQFVKSEYRSDSLHFCVCYCTSKLNDSQIRMLEEMKERGIPILPVVDRNSVIEVVVPPCLRDINVLEVDPADEETACNKIVQYVLEAFGLIREERRVFISYRRVESRHVAMQIHDALVHQGYTVFLDTAIIISGEIFQDELMSQLADSDVLIFLNTSNAFDSKWIRSEYTNAMALRIGILHIDWPGVSVPPEASHTVDMANPFKLGHDDFISLCPLVSAGLKPEVIQMIINAVEKLRVANLAARKTLMIREFCRFLNNSGKNVIAAYSAKDKAIRVLDMKRHAVIRKYFPITGIPKSEVFNKVRKEYCLSRDCVSILYNRMLVKGDVVDYLNWIDSNTLIHLSGFDGFGMEE